MASPGNLASISSGMGLSADIAVKVSTEAAENFVNTYYPALQSNRGILPSFYMLPTTMPNGVCLPSITINGNVMASTEELQTLLEEQLPVVHFEVQAYDCQVVNPNYIAENTTGTVSPSGKNMTILINVSGYVKYGGANALPRGFSENFVLAPNTVVGKLKNKKTHVKEWLILSQNFRLIV